MVTRTGRGPAEAGMRSRSWAAWPPKQAAHGSSGRRQVAAWCARSASCAPSGLSMPMPSARRIETSASGLAFWYVPLTSQ